MQVDVCWPRQLHSFCDPLPLPAAEPEGAAMSRRSSASSSSASSSSSGLPSPPSSPLSGSSSPSPPSPLATPYARSPLPQRRPGPALDRRRHGKPPRERLGNHIPKPHSEPIMFTMKDIRTEEEHREDGSPSPHGLHRRCMTHTDLSAGHRRPSHPAPDLLHLFSIFQFNKPEKAPARMLINVTLVGNIQPVRLLVAYDASVQDVIDSALKAYVKEGRLPQNINTAQNYGLHFSPFSLESIDTTECVSTLGTRNFYLFPSSVQLTNPPEGYDETKPWWNIFRSILS